MDDKDIVKNTMFETPQRARQLIDFSGMCDGKIHPTDVDAMLDFGGDAWVLIEVKHAGKPLDKINGQRIAMENFWRDMPRRVKVLCIVCDHYIDDPSIPVRLQECTVRQILDDNGKWRKPQRKMTVGEMVTLYKRWVDYNKHKQHLH